MACSLGLAVFLQCGTAQAYNVRLKDVENAAMQAGVRAATEERWDDAERLFQVVLQKDSESASAYSNLGNVHLSLGRPLLAMTDFSRAIQLAPEAPVPYMNRALAEEQLGVEAEARGESASALSLYRQAIQDCEEAESLDPKEFAAWFNEGNVQMRLGHFAGALASYTRAADLAPGISGYRLREAALLFETEQPGEAAQQRSDRMIKGVLRRNPYYAEAHAALAAVSWAHGDAAQAETHHNAAQQIDDRWAKLSYVKAHTRWPPRLYKALENFLTFTV